MTKEEFKGILESSTRKEIEEKLVTMGIETWSADDNKADNVNNAVLAYENLIAIQGEDQEVAEEIEDAPEPIEKLEEEVVPVEDPVEDTPEPIVNSEELIVDPVEEEVVSEDQDLISRLEVLEEILVRARANFNNGPHKEKAKIIAANIEKYEAEIAEIKSKLNIV